MVELILVRHCASSGQAAEAALTESGVAQAQTLATALDAHAVDAIVSSPYRRARDTIAPFARRRGLPVRIDPRLAEHRLADPPIDDWRDHVRASFGDLDGRAPGGDSPRETRTRGFAALHDAVAEGARRPLLVTHGQLLALLLDAIRPGFGYAGWASLRNPDVFRVSGPSFEHLDFERLALDGLESEALG